MGSSPHAAFEGHGLRGDARNGREAWLTNPNLRSQSRALTFPSLGLVGLPRLYCTISDTRLSALGRYEQVEVGT